MPTIILPVIDTDAIGWTFNVPTDALATVIAKASVTTTSTTLGGGVQLVNDVTTPGNSQYYGTDGSGLKGYHALALSTVSTRVGVSGSPYLGGDITFIQGSNITLTQSGQDITFAAGGGGGRVLIETLTVSVLSNSVTFATTLNGDADLMYEIEGKIVSGNNVDQNYYFRPNGVSTSQKSIRMDLSGVNQDSNLNLGQAASGNTVKHLWLWCQFQAKTGQARRLLGQSLSTGTTQHSLNTTWFSGWWEDSTTNVTSITLEATSTNCFDVGTVLNLYKVVPLQ